MKKMIIITMMCVAFVGKADTIVIRQPGLIEGVCTAAFGAVRCVGEFATGLVAGSTTVINTPNYVPAPAPVYYPQQVAPVAPAPVMAAPTPVTTAPCVAPAPYVPRRNEPVVIAPNPVTCAPTVYPCSGYGPRYIPRYTRPGCRVYSTYY